MFFKVGWNFSLSFIFVTTLNTRFLAWCGTAERTLEEQHLPAWKTSAFHRYMHCILWKLWKLCCWGSVRWCWEVSMGRVTSVSPWWPQEASFQQRLQCNECGLPFANATQGHFQVRKSGRLVSWFIRMFPCHLATSTAVCCRRCFW